MIKECCTGVACILDGFADKVPECRMFLDGSLDVHQKVVGKIFTCSIEISDLQTAVFIGTRGSILCTQCSVMIGGLYVVCLRGVGV